MCVIDIYDEPFYKWYPGKVVELPSDVEGDMPQPHQSKVKVS